MRLVDALISSKNEPNAWADARQQSMPHFARDLGMRFEQLPLGDELSRDAAHQLLRTTASYVLNDNV